MKTLFNRVSKFKRFVCKEATFSKHQNKECIILEMRPRKNSKPICSSCSQPAPLYDQLSRRLFRFVPCWGFIVFLAYTMRRVSCKQCGVKVEQVPWADGKSPLTYTMKQFLSTWARRLPWNEVALVFGVNWYQVWISVKYIVDYGLAHRSLDDITAIGVDEIHRGKGHQYLTLVYQISGGMRRLLYIREGRSVKSLLRFFHDLGKERCSKIEYVCSDMWKPYLKVIKKKCTNALHILDRFHIVANLNKAVNKVRTAEARQLKKEGKGDLLKNTRYCFLKNVVNLSLKQLQRLDSVLKLDLRSVRAYLLKESFQGVWAYQNAYWAQWYLERWCKRAMRSRLDPIKKFVKSIRKHQPLILNWFKAKKEYNSGIVEGLNRKVNLITRKSYGFRNVEVLKTALFHNMGALPEPPMTHRF